MKIKIYDVETGEMVRDIQVNEYSEYEYFIRHWWIINGYKTVVEGQIG